MMLNARANSARFSRGGNRRTTGWRSRPQGRAFGKPSTLKRGWGYSALVEYGGKRVLFDTGGDTDDFAYNVKTLGIDLTRLDFVVLTHRHGDLRVDSSTS
jgi:glyoxylase-like metal-dependent hydrolase (beta-lactamase superfamily II)